MKLHEWLEKKRKLRNVAPEDRLKELQKLFKKAKTRRVMLGVLLEIRLAKYLVYLKKLKPWRSGDTKSPEDEELADILERTEPEQEVQLSLEEHIPPPPPKKEEKVLGKIYSTEESTYSSKSYRSGDTKSYKTQRPAHGTFGDRVSKEDETRMTTTDRMIGTRDPITGIAEDPKEGIKYERDVKKNKKEGAY